jgi:hypothetical protein
MMCTSRFCRDVWWKDVLDASCDTPNAVARMPPEALYRARATARAWSRSGLTRHPMEVVNDHADSSTEKR